MKRTVPFSSSCVSGISANSEINNSVFGTPSLQNPARSIYNSSFRYQYFCRDGVISNYFEDGTDMMGWRLYLIKKDGTLDLIATSYSTSNQIPFDLQSILSNITDMNQYARTSDGYPRVRINRNHLLESLLCDYNCTYNIQSAASTSQMANIQNNQINISSLSPGFYVLWVIDDNGKSHSVKFRKN